MEAVILITFGGTFLLKISKTQSRNKSINVVQIEASFVSTRRDSDEPTKINI